MELIKQEVSQEPSIKIPEELIEIYRSWRPSPLCRASRLEKFLDTPAKIFYKWGKSEPTRKPQT
jgi:tryptophan synthase beta chain